MSEVASARTTPWHLWVVGGLSLLWNGFGGYGFLMSQIQGETYFRQMGMSEAQIAYVAAYPDWMLAVSALGVGGAVAGSVLLLLRSRFAVHAFVLSLVGIAGAKGYALTVPGGWELIVGAIPVAVAVIGVVLLVYAWVMTRRAVLR